MIRWLFFDVGYTLVDETASWVRRMREQAETPEARVLGLTAEDLWKDIEEASRQYLPQYRTVVEKHGFTRRVPYFCEEDRLYPDAEAVLKALSKQYALGVIANQDKGLEERLSAWSIRPFFSMVASSCEAGMTKPDPGFFRFALAQASCAPQEAVMIGDRLDNDIFPAKSLGMKTVWMKKGFGALQTPRSPVYEPDWTAHSLRELLSLFEAKLIIGEGNT